MKKTNRHSMPCPSCKAPTVPYDTEPWPEMNEITYAYECRCGNVWTECMDHLRIPKIRRASEIRSRAWKAGQRDVIEAVRDVLPGEWRVLPSGASTAKRIAQRADERYRQRNAAVEADFQAEVGEQEKSS